MNLIATTLQGLPRGWDEGLSWAAGAAITLGLFLGMARFEHAGAPAPEIEELHVVSMPVDLPPVPPPPVEQEHLPEQTAPLAGIDVATSDSPVRIQALPPEFATLLAPAPLPPRRLDALGRIPAGLKPSSAQLENDLRHVYQQSEVDQRPQVIGRTVPMVPSELFGRASALRVVLLLTIDQQGRVENVRVSGLSGQPAFDAIVLRTVRDEWAFSPAIRRGKRVRCLAEQSIRIALPGGSPFSLP